MHPCTVTPLSKQLWAGVSPGAAKHGALASACSALTSPRAVVIGIRGPAIVILQTTLFIICHLIRSLTHTVIVVALIVLIFVSAHTRAIALPVCSRNISEAQRIIKHHAAPVTLLTTAICVTAAAGQIVQSKPRARTPGSRERWLLVTIFVCIVAQRNLRLWMLCPQRQTVHLKGTADVLPRVA